MRSSSRWSLPVYCLACRRAPVSGHARSRFSSARALLAALLLSASSSAWSDEAQVARPSPYSDTLFGDWGGFKHDLSDRGIDFTLDYTTESASNVTGGLRAGTAYAHHIGLSIDADWEKIAGLTGCKTHTILMNRAGRNASEDYIGDPLVQAQEIYGAGFDQAVKLIYFYGEQTWLNDKVNLAATRLTPS